MATGPQTRNALRPFVFLELPAELRNQIYELLYPNVQEKTAAIFREPQRFHDIVRPLFFGPSKASQAPDMSLLQTCHEIHDEAAEMAYTRTHFGLFLVGTRGRRHANQHMEDQIIGFGRVFINRNDLIQHLDLGVQDLGAHMQIGLQRDADPSTLKGRVGNPLLSATKAEVTASRSRVLLARLLKDLSAHLPQIRCITIHDSVGGRQTFIRHLTELFPRLGELRVVRLQPGFGMRRFRVEGNHLLKWEYGADLGRLLLGQKFRDLR
ncbi:hypothetical protein LTR36_002070 [Oleoguttula mirabilis]|uniref:2EXR domain-containing protein n=1 Tax=Oleoguttula mirabilis TaxID=1507867 RepID=A0AAV9JMU8_9PEZI|nr:hypothetical protein LTR36_002070 [Oleoguttula mirabilis]